jgi:hypothetical protein
MSTSYSEYLERVRKIARDEAEAALVKLGLTANGQGGWRGAIDCDSYGRIPISLGIPALFPDAIPEVYVNRASLPCRIPHVEKSGKVCIADATGLLVDAGNPRGIITESLQRARSTLIDGLSGRNRNDLKKEFLAYWNAGASSGVWSICAPGGDPRSIRKVWLQHGRDTSKGRLLLAENLDDAKRWALKIGWQTGKSEEAFSFPLLQLFEPPDFEERPTVAQMLEIIQASVSEDTWHNFYAWLSRATLPTTLLLFLPNDHAQVVMGIEMPASGGQALKKAANGFRPGKIPPLRQLTFSLHEPVGKLAIDRFDPEYLLHRGGASAPLFSKSVTVVGCGSVGSRVADLLASAGVGCLRLIDHDMFKPENVHRHALGTASVSFYKTVGLRAALQMKFPHLTIECKEEKVERVLEHTPEFITDSSLVVIAVGDETLELRLNNILQGQVPRIHAWVEPQGLGGHVLSTGISRGPGCFRCLFDTNEQYGLFNQAAFAAPGQRFQQSFAGCGGSFTPFANADATQTAIEAARLVADILLGKETENVLLSWRGDGADFTAAGFHLSLRGKMVRAGERRREVGFHKAQCPDCHSQSL